MFERPIDAGVSDITANVTNPRYRTQYTEQSLNEAFTISKEDEC